MILVIGGVASGKRTYVQSLGFLDAEIEETASGVPALGAGMPGSDTSSDRLPDGSVGNGLVDDSTVGSACDGAAGSVDNDAPSNSLPSNGLVDDSTVGSACDDAAGSVDNDAPSNSLPSVLVDGSVTNSVGHSGTGMPGDNTPCDVVLSEKPVLYGLEELLWQGPLTDNAVAAVCNKHVVCCCEVGMGVVPMDVQTRIWRERVGRTCMMLADRAEKVVRMVCGIPVTIKEAGEGATL